MYMSMMMGIAMLALSALETVRNRFTSIAIVYGRTALFYYVVHFLLIHIIATIAFFVRGTHTFQEALDSTVNMPFLFVIPDVGYSLPVVYLIWITVVVIMYPLCRWHDNNKLLHKGAWWVSYL